MAFVRSSLEGSTALRPGTRSGDESTAHHPRGTAIRHRLVVDSSTQRRRRGCRRGQARLEGGIGSRHSAKRARRRQLHSWMGRQSPAGVVLPTIISRRRMARIGKLVSRSASATRSLYPAPSCCSPQPPLRRPPGMTDVCSATLPRGSGAPGGGGAATPVGAARPTDPLLMDGRDLNTASPLAFSGGHFTNQSRATCAASWAARLIGTPSPRQSFVTTPRVPHFILIGCRSSLSPRRWRESGQAIAVAGCKRRHCRRIYTFAGLYRPWAAGPHAAAQGLGWALR